MGKLERVRSGGTGAKGRMVGDSRCQRRKVGSEPGWMVQQGQTHFVKMADMKGFGTGSLVTR